MKVIILSTALLTIVVCATIGLTYSNKEKSTMNSILNTKGLPEQGLIFIEPTDAYYQQVMDTTMQNQTSPSFDALKPFSVLLKNNSNKVLIAFKLKWEVEDGNGQVTTTTNGYMNSRRLFNVEDKSKTKSVLDSNEATFCSMAGCHSN